MNNISKSQKVPTGYACGLCVDCWRGGMSWVEVKSMCRDTFVMIPW